MQMIEICILPFVQITMWQYMENVQNEFYLLTLARRRVQTDVFAQCRIEYKLNKQLLSSEKFTPACHLRGSWTYQDILSLCKPLPTWNPTSFGFSVDVLNVQAPQHLGRVIISHFTPNTREITFTSATGVIQL